MPPTASNGDLNPVYEMMSTEGNTLRNISPTESIEPTIELLSGPVTYRAAIKNDNNLVHEAEYVASTASFNTQLWEGRWTIEHLTRHHLGLHEQNVCVVAPMCHWIRGSFNLGEAKNPGSIDEKMSCEVGTYAWIQDRCPDIRIPYLYGFGFSDHRQFTHAASRSCEGGT
ncbi:hypothetical protein HYQ45_018533 [Verticillium longisporum]|uniref:Uncharacterized protein n=1 Tax=Verticillium longisporum TaxID=100787 RepID=A0A8I3AG88_VERLO|nr:hypothetical protein HYQ45_018533 [Verticillium longisporum]